jgi:phage replication O-like protein O
VASPQLEDGYLSLANEVVEALSKARLSGSQFQIVLYVFRKTYGWVGPDGAKKKADRISHSQIAKATGLSKGTVSNEVIKLTKLGVLTKQVECKGCICVIGFQKDYDKWQLPGFGGYSSNSEGYSLNDEECSQISEGGYSQICEPQKKLIQKKEILPSVTDVSDLPNTALGWWQKVLEHLGETKTGKSSYGLIQSLIKQHGEGKVCEQTWDIYQCCLSEKVTNLRQAIGWLRARFKSTVAQTSNTKPHKARVIL